MNSPTSPSNRVWWVLLGGCAAFWLVYVLFFLPRGPQPGAGAPADQDWQLLDLDDRPVPFTKFQGKAVFLNVWATWCPPCVHEMPSIARLAANPRLKDVVFVCASTDNSSETVRQFLGDKHWRMTFLRAPELPPSFKTNAIPATFIIGPDGKIVTSEIGSADWDTPEKVELLERLARTP